MTLSFPSWDKFAASAKTAKEICTVKDTKFGDDKQEIGVRKLILFDIDGTILNSSGAGRAAMERALDATFNTPGDSSYRYDGRTDRQIVREQMRGAGYSDAQIDARMPTVMQLYLDGLRDELTREGRTVKMYDGVAALIDTIAARDDAVLGLLTGNIQAGAHLKLATVGLDTGMFRVNAFGSDHELRAELPGIAHQRMRDTFGVALAGRDVIIIGDTPSDVTCGQTLGARAIAVATGRYSTNELQAYDPFAVFNTLADTSAVLKTIYA
jgi:phosphoglycolate phosphatase-like HAD superfamily hydrolase